MRGSLCSIAVLEPYRGSRALAMMIHKYSLLICLVCKPAARQLSAPDSSWVLSVCITIELGRRYGTFTFSYTWYRLKTHILTASSAVQGRVPVILYPDILSYKEKLFMTIQMKVFYLEFCYKTLFGHLSSSIPMKMFLYAWEWEMKVRQVIWNSSR